MMSIFIIFGLNGCGDQVMIRVGTIKGPQTELFKVVKKLALHRHGIRVHLIAFDSYKELNTALRIKGIDANVFQHQAYLQEVLVNNAYPLLCGIGEIFVSPMGIYSDKLTHLEDLKPYDVIGIPLDRSNQDRALRFLEKCKLIQLKQSQSPFVNLHSIQENRKRLRFNLYDVSLLNTHLEECHLVVMDTYYASCKTLNLQHALAIEKSVAARQYAHLFVVREEDKNNQYLKQISFLCKDDEVIKKAQQLFQNSISFV